MINSLTNTSLEVMNQDEMLNTDGGLIAGAVFGAIFGFGAGLVKQCAKVVVCEIAGYDGVGSSFSWAGVGASTVSGLIGGACSPF